MSSPYFRRPLRTLEEERELFEPIYSVGLVRKWKLEKLKKVTKNKK